MGVAVCMEEDRTTQLEELESLEAIYGSDFNLLNDSTCIINIRPNLTEYGAMEIKVILPEDYPSCSPPLFEIRRSELSHKEKQEIAIHLSELFNIGDVVIYQSVEWIREYITNRANKLSETTSESQSVHGAKKELSDLEEPEVMHTLKEDLIDLTVQSPNSQKVDTDLSPVDMVYSPNIIHGEPLVDRKSTFQAHATEVHSSQEVEQVMSILKENRKIAMATHNILAYRFVDENKGGVLVQDCEDDGESAAGGRLLHLLQVMDVCNILVVVSRWYGGVQLGPDRFKHINNVARTLLQNTGMGIKAVSVTGKAIKDRNKGKLKKHKS